jgi:hypothetical protein
VVWNSMTDRPSPRTSTSALRCAIFGFSGCRR